ncbi:NmrA family transcriptional regulator [Nakamurella silvestris]|nr:NmrA family transcriptional regulator [Nakamurella silvestris]
MTNYLVTGGTGRTGHRITDRLRAENHQVRVASRTGSRPFDWNAPGTWDAQLDGVHAAYLCYSPDLAFPGAAEIMGAFSARALSHGVQRLVLLSGRGEEGAEKAERQVLDSGVSAAVVRCAWFSQNFSESFLIGPLLRGRLALPAGEVTEPFVDLDDVAEVALHALTSPAIDGDIFELTGPDSLSFDQIAAQLGAATGRRITFAPVTAAEFIQDMGRDGLAAEEAAPLADLFTEILDGRNEATTDTISRVLGRPATTFADYARRAAATGVWNG